VEGGITEDTQRECDKPRSATEVMGRYGEWKGELRSIHKGSATNQDLQLKLWGGMESGRGNYGAGTEGRNKMIEWRNKMKSRKITGDCQHWGTNRVGHNHIMRCIQGFYGRQITKYGHIRCINTLPCQGQP